MSSLLPKPTVVNQPQKASDVTEVETRPFSSTGADIGRNCSTSNRNKPAKSAGSSKGRLGIALVVGAIADGVQAMTLTMPVILWLIDIATAIVFFAIFGFRKTLILPIVIELIPGIAMAPTWTVAAVLLHTTAPKAD